MDNHEISTFHHTYDGKLYILLYIVFVRNKSVSMQCVQNEFDKEGNVTGSERKLNTDVSFDGTWLTRGHKSHIGVVVNHEVVSHSYLSCVQMKKKRLKQLQ